MRDLARPLTFLISVTILTLTLICGFACLAPAEHLRGVAAQSMSPNRSYGFLIEPSFGSPSPDATGVAILGVMNFDGAGNVTGPYMYEVDANQPDAAKTTTGTLTGTYSSSPDGTGSVTMALHGGISLTLAMVISDAGKTIRLVATDYQFPAASCLCNVSKIVLTGTASAAPVGSVSGAFGFQFHNVPNVNASLGVATFDGAGNVAVSFTFVGASDSKGQPTGSANLTQTGTYSINADGTGTIDLAASPESNRQTYSFVVTDNGAGILLIQTDRRGSGVSFGTGRLQ